MVKIYKVAMKDDVDDDTNNDKSILEKTGIEDEPDAYDLSMMIFIFGCTIV